ncbi:MAG TPA: 2OG-Fe(II) oxygenase [Methylophilaceae bacterium]
MDISPQGGTLVVFFSDQFWHEVLPAKRDRFSIAGWFKNRG